MSDPRFALRDVTNKILSVVNQMERNTTVQPPSQTSSLMQTQPARQISQTARPVSQIQAQISQTSWSTPSSRTVSEFNRLFHQYRKNSPSSGNSSTGRRKSTQMRQVTFTVFCLGRKDTKNVSGTEEKVEMFLAGLGEKRVTFPFTDYKVEFIETMSENYPILKDIKLDVFRAERNAKEMVFVQPPPTGYSAIYLKTIIDPGRLYVRPQMNLMKDNVVYLENDDMYKVKEAFGIF